MAGAGAGSGTNTTGTKRFDLGLFLDNDEDYITDVSGSCNKIKAIKIDETPKSEKFGLILTSDEYETFLKGLSEEGQAAASILKKILDRQGIFEESYDPKSGIQEKHVTEIKEWVTKNKEKKLAVILDFDRTLTMMEGGDFHGNSVQDWKNILKERFTEKKVVSSKHYGYQPVKTTSGVQLYEWHWKRPSNGKVIQIPIQAGQNIRSFLDTFTGKGYAEYLAGSLKRFEMLQKMFDFLYENKVECFVLTNNDACKDSNGLLQELVQVYTKGRPIEILCGLDYNYKKSEAIKAHTSLRTLCPQSGGRKTRRRKSKSKKTRRTRS